MPAAIALALGHARLAGIQQFERVIDRLAHRRPGLGTDAVARLERVVDDAGKLVVGHDGIPASWAAVCRWRGRGCQAACEPLKLPPTGNAKMRRIICFCLGLTGLISTTVPAFAHHVMGGKTPSTFREGILSGLGHPVIGIDHFAAVVAVGCLAAAHRAGPAPRGRLCAGDDGRRRRAPARRSPCRRMN